MCEGETSGCPFTDFNGQPQTLIAKFEVVSACQKDFYDKLKRRRNQNSGGVFRFYASNGSLPDHSPAGRAGRRLRSPRRRGLFFHLGSNFWSHLC